MDDVHHGLEQRQAFGRESEAAADHHTVIVGARQRLLEHRAPSGIWRDHASIALPPVFLYLFDAQGDPGVDLFGIEAGRQGGGQKPETVDFSAPSLPPGFNAEKINAGIALGVKKIEEHGWKGDTCMITPDAAGSAMLEKALTGADYDCVVIGGGMRLPPKGLVLFETVVNIIHKAAPNAAIAFNTRPEDTADAAARQLKAT